MKTMEERLDEENQKLKDELETTQEALNYILMGGDPSE